MTRGRRALAFAALLLGGVDGVGCKKKGADPIEGAPANTAGAKLAAARPMADGAVPRGPPPIAQLLADARTRADATRLQLPLMQFKASYVRADGELDATYGTLEIAFHGAHTAVKTAPDDPARPTGAPPPSAARTVDPMMDELFNGKCPQGKWTAGEWTWRADGSCSPNLYDPPRCTLAEVWKRAIAKGAPRDALAVIDLDDDAKATAWLFRIDDPPRDIAVSLSLPDDCGVAVEVGPVGKPPASLGELDDAAVAAGVRAVRPALEKCHETGAMVHVELAVHVAKSGAVDEVKILAAPDTATGRCAVQGMRTAMFPPSTSGIQMTVPLEL